MPRYIVKPKRDEDFYVEYSTIVDSIVGWGTREQFKNDPALGRNVDERERRLARTDKYGTSCLVDFGDGRWYGWDDEEFTMREGVNYIDEPSGEGFWTTPYIARDDLRAFCETYDDDTGVFNPPEGMTAWEIHEDD